MKIRPILALGAAFSALALLATPAAAQKGYADDGVIVILPPVYSTGVYGPNGRERSEVRVSTRDLDLRYAVDVETLNQRIRDGARLACDVLDDAARLDPGEERECRRDAQRNAMREARAMINYARG